MVLQVLSDLAPWFILSPHCSAHLLHCSHTGLWAFLLLPPAEISSFLFPWHVPTPLSPNPGQLPQQHYTRVAFPNFSNTLYLTAFTIPSQFTFITVTVLYSKIFYDIVFGICITHKSISVMEACTTSVLFVSAVTKQTPSGLPRTDPSHHVLCLSLLQKSCSVPVLL